LQLAKNDIYKQKQLECFPFENDLPLKTIKNAFEASLIKEDPVSTAEMLLIHASNIKKVFIKSPLCILKDINIEDNDNKIDNILERSLKIADLYDRETRIIWYLLIAWYLDSKNKTLQIKIVINRLSEKELVFVNEGGHLIDFLIYCLYEKYREKIIKIFDYLSDDDIYKICLYFIKDKKGQIGLEIFGFIKDKDPKIKDLVENMIKNSVVIENALIKKIIKEYKNLSKSEKSATLYSIFEYVGNPDNTNQYINVLGELIQAAKAIDYSSGRSKALSDIASAISQFPNQLDNAQQLLDDLIQAAKAIEYSSGRSKALSGIASAIANKFPNLTDKAIQAAKAIDNSYNRSKALSGVITLQLNLNEDYSKDPIEWVTASLDDNLSDLVSKSLENTDKLWNYIIRQFIGYPEFSHLVCPIIANRYPEHSLQIADLILKY
jgi:hypothetical protein